VTRRKLVFSRTARQYA